MKKHIPTILFVIGMIIGVSLLLYPTLSDSWNKKQNADLIATYDADAASADTKTLEAELAKAEAYNQRLAETGTKWVLTDEEKAEYDSLLDLSGMGIMGHVDIPKIGVSLPIYHGTDEAVLQMAIGHLEGTSLPIGGESTHCVISGHRGLPSAKLFTDIDQLAEGDLFTLTVLDRTITYEVDQIRIVLPDELQNLEIEEGKDYCTLVTCTPYGINTHRLLVRGHRVEGKTTKTITEDARQISTTIVACLFGGSLLVIIGAVYLISLPIRKSRQRKKEKYRKMLS